MDKNKQTNKYNIVYVRIDSVVDLFIQGGQALTVTMWM